MQHTGVYKLLLVCLHCVSEAAVLATSTFPVCVSHNPRAVGFVSRGSAYFRSNAACCAALLSLQHSSSLVQAPSVQHSSFAGELEVLFACCISRGIPCVCLGSIAHVYKGDS
jgi:hypothetical protein